MDEEDKQILFLAAISGMLGGFFDMDCLEECVDPEVIDGFFEELGESQRKGEKYHGIWTWWACWGKWQRPCC